MRFSSSPSLLPALVLGCAVLPAFAADNQNTPAPSPEPTQQYTDGGRTTTTVTTHVHEPFYPGRSYPYDRHNGIIGGVRSFDSSITTQYLPIYFPPNPPALGEPIPQTPPAAALARFAPPFTLANFVSEPFYAPLSTLLYNENLDRRRREKLDAYRAERNAALTALRAKLDATEATEPAARRAELAAFAREQAPALLALEAQAEEMRDNFTSGSLLQSGVDWDDTRGWRLGDNTRWESTIDEIKVVRAAAFFFDGLSPAQRRLLRELAMELQDSLAAPDASISLSAPGPFFYFGPETARISLPPNLPAELDAKIADYEAVKNQLKRELRELLYKQDRAFWKRTRVNASKQLAEQQAPHFARLEALAEEIRLGLAPLPNPAKPPTVSLPRDTFHRISAYSEKKTAWQRAMVAKLEELRAAFPDDRVEHVRQGSGMTIQIIPNRKTSALVASRRTAAEKELAAFNASQSRIYTELTREKDVVRDEIIQVVSQAAGKSPNKTIEQLLAEFNFAFSRQERWERYHDYEIAVLLPGLSPEQRRLLFGAAIEKLDLPLATL